MMIMNIDDNEKYNKSDGGEAAAAEIWRAQPTYNEIQRDLTS